MIKPWKPFQAFMILIIVVLFIPGLLFGADRIYFAALVGNNSQTARREVLLEWGPLEGELPGDITDFILYRKRGSEGFQQIGIIPYSLASIAQIQDIFNEPGALVRKLEIIENLDSSNQAQGLPPVNGSNYASVLHDLLDPNSPTYDSMKRMLLVRLNPDVARCVGLAYFDRTVNTTNTYEYILTAKLLDNTESKPIGRTLADASALTILPAPANFRQVFVAGCSEIRQGLDDRRIHFSWDIPVEPNKMALKILIYGYDIYRSDINLGTLNLRSGIPSGIVKTNDIPILVSGNPADEGPDSFLAVDEGDIFENEYMTRGDVFYYYLVARDIYGKYSETAGPLEARVPDRQSPVMPWGVHTEREEVVVGSNTVPRLSFVWDQINPENYIKAYGSNREICPESTPTQICYVRSGADCSLGIPACVDLDVSKYLIYRFSSPEEASLWGADSDGDLWPDLREDPNKNKVIDPGETDPCDPTSHQSGTPPELVAVINHGDPSNTRTLPPSGRIVQFFQDPVIKDDNKVHWYRIQAEDFNQNRSPLSPPVRAVLFDRSQPKVDAELSAWKCFYKAYFLNIKLCEEHNPESILSLIDQTGDARQYAIYLRCPYQERESTTLLKRDKMKKHAYLFPEDIRDCELTTRCTVIVRFYDAQGHFLAETSFFVYDLCSPVGCVILEKGCKYRPVGPGEVHDPEDLLHICVHLKPGECARLYHLIGGSYSPFEEFCADTADDCADSDPNTFGLKVLPPLDGCLGLRVFSKNHVGSGLHRFPCVTLSLGPPDRPLIESVHCDCEAKVLWVRWAAQAYGLVAFIIARQSGQRLVYEAVTGIKPDPETGQYTYAISLDPNEFNMEWCVSVRALNESLMMSEWSSEACEMCCEEKPGPLLPWPPVSLPPSGPEVMSFYLKGTDVLAVVLSEDLSDDLLYYMRNQCEMNIPECNEKVDCFRDRNTQFYCEGICDLLRRSNELGQFVLYRQEEKKDFVQVGPLIETFYCPRQRSATTVSIHEELKDPFIYLAGLTSGVIFGVETDIKGSLSDTVRLLYLDKYPFAANTRVRYKIVRMSASETPKIIETRFSNWVEIP